MVLIHERVPFLALNAPFLRSWDIRLNRRLPNDKTLRGIFLYGPGDTRYQDICDPEILKPTDAIIRLALQLHENADQQSH